MDSGIDTCDIYRCDCDADADDDADGHYEQRAEATINAAESGRGSYYNWAFH